jgi:hypothetical protein
VVLRIEPVRLVLVLSFDSLALELPDVATCCEAAWLGTYRDVRYRLFCSYIRQDLEVCLNDCEW